MQRHLWMSGLLLILTWLVLAGVGTATAPATRPGGAATPTTTQPASSTPDDTTTPTPMRSRTPPTVPPPTRTPTATCASPWQVVPSPNLGTRANYLTGVAAVAPDDLWAVGYYTASSGVDQTLVEHWDGVRWTIRASPNLGSGATHLNAVLVLSATDLWAVGYATGLTTTVPLALHGNGSIWTPMLVPGVGRLTALAAVSPTDLWAVGYVDGIPGVPARVLTMHWDGSQWTNVPGPAALEPYDGYLYGVAVGGPNDVWAVGSYYFEMLSVTAHWNGQIWTLIPSPNVFGPLNVLTAVTALATNDVWAVGYCCHDPEGPIALHWDGSTWQLFFPPFSAYYVAHLYGVAAVSPTDLWAGGFSDINFGELIDHWDGSQWARVRGPSDQSGRVINSIVALAATDVWAGGHDGGFDYQLVKHTSVLHYAGPCPATTPTPTPTICPVQFNDVPAGDPFYPYIHCLACRSIVSGYADGTFRPGANVTRSQASKLVANAAALGDPIPSTQQTFADVPSANPFWLWIERLARRGIISGYACGGPGELCDAQHRPYFRWGSSLTRGQLAKIAANTVPWADAIPISQQSFADVPATQPFWLYVERALAHGVVSGYACGGSGEPCDPPQRPYYRPGANVTRGQSAKIVANTFFPGCRTP